MRNARMTFCLVLVFGVVTGSTKAYFELHDNEQLTVNSYHYNGALYDTSQVFIVSGASIGYAIYGYGSSTINISGGYVDTPNPRDSSTLNMSGGSARWFSAQGSSTSNISGGSIDELYAVDSPMVNISGGFIESLHARDTSTTNIFGQNFQYGSGLILNGHQVLGTGILSGEWLDGTPWAIDIMENDSTATITIEPVSNDYMNKAIAVTVGLTISGSSIGATGVDITHNGYKDNKDVWYAFTSPSDGDYIIGTLGSSFDTTLAVFDEGLIEMEFNDDYNCKQSKLMLKAAAGVKYFIRIAGYNGQTGNYRLSIIHDGPEPLLSDINSDGNVNNYDLAILASEWLKSNN